MTTRERYALRTLRQNRLCSFDRVLLKSVQRIVQQDRALNDSHEPDRRKIDRVADVRYGLFLDEESKTKPTVRRDGHTYKNRKRLQGTSFKRRAA